MRNIKLTIEYDGTGFNGWQIQRQRLDGKRIRTIQGEIEKAAKRLFGKRITIIGAGRTDAGVHARAQVANFRIDSKLSLDDIKHALNSLLPKSISIVKCEEASLDFHAQFDSKGKIYRYTILNRTERSPLANRFSAFISYKLDIKKMRRASTYLIGRKDFKSFQAADRFERDSVRTIKGLDIISRPPFVEICINADGFLYNMVRNIVGTLIEVGRGYLKPKDVKKILEKKNRLFAGYCAPAKGLCLEKVFY